MSGKGEDKNSVAETVEAACEKVGEAGAAAAQKAKETAAHLQPGGSQVGKVVQEQSDGSEKVEKKPQ